MVYEGLIGTPILLLAGLFGNDTVLEPLTNVSQWFIPITAPIAALSHNKSLNWSSYFCSLLLWIVLIVVIVRKINDLVRRKGALKII